MNTNMSLEVVGSDCTVLAVGTTEGPLPRVSEKVAPQPSGVHGGVAAVGAPMNLPSGVGPPNPAMQRSNIPRLHLWATHLFSTHLLCTSTGSLKETSFFLQNTLRYKMLFFLSRLVRRHCDQTSVENQSFYPFLDFTIIICDMYTVRHGITKHCAAR